MRSGITASAPSFSKRSTIWLFARGENLTRISPTIPTFAFSSEERGSASKSRTIPLIFLLNSRIGMLFLERLSMQIFFHF